MYIYQCYLCTCCFESNIALLGDPNSVVSFGELRKHQMHRPV